MDPDGLKYRENTHSCCQTIKQGVKRSHPHCILELLSLECEWWLYSIYHCILTHNKDMFRFCMTHNAPIHESFVVRALCHQEIEMAKELLETGYRYMSRKDRKLIQNPINLDTISIGPVIDLKHLKEIKWMFDQPGFRIGQKEAERAARHGMLWILERYFAQETPLKSRMMVRNAYRSGSVECLRFLLDQKCVPPNDIFLNESNAACYKEMLDRLEEWCTVPEDYYFTPLLDAILSCFYCNQERPECIEVLIDSNRLTKGDMERLMVQIDMSSELRSLERKYNRKPIESLQNILDYLVEASIYLADSPEVTEWLIERGAKLQIDMIRLSSIEHPAMIEWVVKRGAMITPRCLEYHVFEQRFEIVILLIYYYFSQKCEDTRLRRGHYWVSSLADTLEHFCKNINGRNQLRRLVSKRFDMVKWILDVANPFRKITSDIYKKEINRICHYLGLIYNKVTKSREYAEEVLMEKGVYRDLLFEICQFIC